MTVRVACIGAGWQGMTHIKNLLALPDTELVGVCDIASDRRETVHERWGVATYADYREMFAQTRPDAIVLCTHPDFRLEVVQEAAGLGIHCFMEKPPARTLLEAEQMEQVIRDSQMISSVGFMFRYSSAVQMCKQLITGRRVALVSSMMLDGLALRENWPRWYFDREISGGAMFDQGIHMVDLGRYLFGDVVSVTGFQANISIPRSEDFTVEDSIASLIRYKSGMMQNHLHSWAYPDFTCQFHIFSDELNLVLDIANHSVSGHIEGRDVGGHSYPDEQLYQKELESFIEAVKTGNPSHVMSDYSDAVRSLRTTAQLVQALETNRIVDV